MLPIGLDVHWRDFVVCILDGNGKRIKEIRGKGGWERLLESLGQVRQPFAICYEASCG